MRTFLILAVVFFVVALPVPGRIFDDSIVLSDYIAQSVGRTLGIGLFACLGRLYKPNRTLGFAIAAAVFTVLTVLAGQVRQAPASAKTERSAYPAVAPEEDSFAEQEPQEDSGALAVKGFYLSLAEGDGYGASRYIVPEKRTGNFDPAALTEFYGNMTANIMVSDINNLGKNRYAVRYQYKAGESQRSVCRGTAIVTVTNREGVNLIQKIKALDGC